MDSNDTLTQVLDAAAAIQNAHEQGYVPTVTDAVALDEWLSNGGLRRGAWRR